MFSWSDDSEVHLVAQCRLWTSGNVGIRYYISNRWLHLTAGETPNLPLHWCHTLVHTFAYIFRLVWKKWRHTFYGQSAFWDWVVNKFVPKIWHCLTNIAIHFTKWDVTQLKLTLHHMLMMNSSGQDKHSCIQCPQRHTHPDSTITVILPESLPLPQKASQSVSTCTTPNT